MSIESNVKAGTAALSEWRRQTVGSVVLLVAAAAAALFLWAAYKTSDTWMVTLMQSPLLLVSLGSGLLFLVGGALMLQRQDAMQARLFDQIRETEHALRAQLAEVQKRLDDCLRRDSAAAQRIAILEARLFPRESPKDMHSDS